MFRQQSTFSIDGSNRSIVDVWFAYDKVNTAYTADYDLDVCTLFLPTAWNCDFCHFIRH